MRPKVLEESILIRVPQCGAAHPGLRCAETLLLQPLGQLSRTWGSGAPGKVTSGQEHPPQSATVWPANSRHSCVLCAALRSDRPRSPPLEDVLGAPRPHSHRCTHWPVNFPQRSPVVWPPCEVIVFFLFLLSLVNFLRGVVQIYYSPFYTNSLFFNFLCKPSATLEVSSLKS